MKRIIIALTAAGFAFAMATSAQASGWGGGIKYGSAAGAYGKFAYGDGFADGSVKGKCGSKCKGESTSYASNESKQGKYSVSNESYATNTVTFQGGGKKPKKPSRDSKSYGDNGYGGSKGSSGSAIINSYSSAMSGSGIGHGKGYKNGYVKRY